MHCNCIHLCIVCVADTADIDNNHTNLTVHFGANPSDNNNIATDDSSFMCARLLLKAPQFVIGQQTDAVRTEVCLSVGCRSKPNWSLSSNQPPRTPTAGWGGLAARTGRSVERERAGERELAGSHRNAQAIQCEPIARSADTMCRRAPSGSHCQIDRMARNDKPANRRIASSPRAHFC